MCSPGDVYLNVSDDHDEDHYWVIIGGPDQNDKILAVNFTDTDNFDGSCVLADDEYIHLTKKSVVNFPQAQINSIQKLKKARRWNKIEFLEHISGDVLIKIRNHANASDHLSPAAKRLL